MVLEAASGLRVLPSPSLFAFGPCYPVPKPRHKGVHLQLGHIRGFWSLSRTLRSHVPSITFMMVEKPKEGGDHFIFGPYKIGVSEVFFTSPHSFAFVNLRPVVPGHVLVCTKRVVPRYLDLTDDEVTDLWISAKRVGTKLEPHYGGSSLTFGIQDGVYAGQTVPHVHVHILPRKAGDFEIMDKVYDEMDRQERELKKRLDSEAERKDRDRGEMCAEASELRKLFS